MQIIKSASLVESFRSDCFTSLYQIIKSDALLQVNDNKILCINEIKIFISFFEPYSVIKKITKKFVVINIIIIFV
jgi:hypothetical protein